MQEKVRQSRGTAELYDWVQSLVVAFVACMLIFLFVGRVVRVEGSSMYDTLIDNDFVITSKLFYTPKNGDIVVFYNEYDDEPLVKRVIATGGQTVSIDTSSSTVYVDGVALEEPYTYTPTVRSDDVSGTVTVPEGYLFCMGDNRLVSRDSRSNTVGFVDERALVGHVICLLFPGEDHDLGRDFSRMGAVS